MAAARSRRSTRIFLTSLGTSRRWVTWQVAAWGSEVPQRGRCGSDWGNPRTRGEGGGECATVGGSWVADGWPRKRRGDFERGSVVEVVVAEVVGGRGGGGGGTVSWRKRWQGVDSESRGEGGGGGPGGWVA